MHASGLMQSCLDSDKVYNQFHFQAMDHHNILRYNDHSSNQWCSLDNSSTRLSLNHKVSHVHYNYTVDNRGSSSNQADIDYTLVRKCLVDNCIGLWLNDIHHLLNRCCHNRMIDSHLVRIHKFEVHIGHIDVQLHLSYTCKNLHVRRTFY